MQLERHMHPDALRGVKSMKATVRITLSLLATASLVLAQAAQGGWQPVGGSGQSSAAGQPLGPPPAVDPPPPAQLTLKSGTFITVRVNQYLSSDKNQNGDAFTASLVRP